MAGIVLALLAAASYGASDFFGGLSSRRAPVPVILFYSQLASVAPLLVALWLLPGVLDMTGNFFYVFAVRHGPLAVIAVITALYPAATVLLAKAVLRERLPRPRGWGRAPPWPA